MFGTIFLVLRAQRDDPAFDEVLPSAVKAGCGSGTAPFHTFNQIRAVNQNHGCFNLFMYDGFYCTVIQG